MNAMNVDSLYVHALEGRLRIKIPKVKGAAGKAQKVERHLHQFTGVESASANPVTGSVLVLYDPRLIDQEEIIASLKELGYLSQASHDASRAVISHSGSQGPVEKVTATVAATLMEFALSRLVSALI
jgi:copper chaperone CopZ